VGGVLGSDGAAATRVRWAVAGLSLGSTRPMLLGGNFPRHHHEMAACQHLTSLQGSTMRQLAAYSALCLATLAALPAEAQTRSLRRSGEEVLILNVRPRSYLDAGNVVPVGSVGNFATSGRGQTASYLLSPPYANTLAGQGSSSLPDPITNGPFVGAQNPFSPVDWVAPRW
jgi:hypothetical protein